MEEMRVQEMLCEAGTLSQVVWPEGWRVNSPQTGARERTAQLSKDPVFTEKFNGTTLAGCKIALPGNLRESISLAQDASPARLLS